MLHFFWTPYRFTLGAYERYESANAEFVKYARRYFEGVTPTHITHYNSGRVTDRAEDILLGHPTWDPVWTIRDRCFSVTNDWVRDNALTPDAPGHPNTYILIPWLPFFPPEAHMPFAETQYAAAKRIFAVCGKYWFQKTLALADGSIQERVKDKLVRVDMGCAAQLFPHKTAFSRASRRRLLHVSNLGPAKNVPLMLRSVEGIDVELAVASGQMASAGLVEAPVTAADGIVKTHHFRSLGKISNNDPETNRMIVEHFDFYLHTSRYDAQATVILENAARGLVPLVTPESGFDCPHAIYLTQDPEKNREIIHRAVTMGDDEYAERSRGVRAHILEHHDWDRIYSRIREEIRADIAGQEPGAEVAI